MSENQLQISNKKIKHENVIYLINLNEKTASVILNMTLLDNIIISRSINYESNDYVIASISKEAFQWSQAKSIKFAPDSELQIIERNAFTSSSIENFTIPLHLQKICHNAFSHCLQLRTIEIPPNAELKMIEREAFACSSIESISIPSNLIELEEGWCANTSKLTKIKVSPKNPRYCLIDEKIIIGKRKIESEKYENLVFCIRNIEKVTIPSFIKTIEALSFNRCKIKKIIFPKNSELQIIKKFAFFDSLIQSFTIPHHLTKIEESAFSHCYQLKKIEIEINSKLDVIQKSAFSYSSIMSFVIPPLVSQIGEYAFDNCKKLQIIEINEKLKNNIFNIRLFNDCEHIVVLIPSK